MTREEFILELRTADGAPEDEPFSRSAQRIADYDADRRVLIKDQRAEIERLTHELHQSNEACAAVREGKPLGPIIGAQTILNQAKEIARLHAQLKEHP